MEYVANRINIYAPGGTPIHHMAILKQYFDKKGPDTVIKQGYILGDGEAVWHVWLEDLSGTKYDIIYELAQMNIPALKNISNIYSLKCPPGLKVMERPDLIKIMNLYTTDPKEFWKQAPEKVRSFNRLVLLK
jgi:hypothetical protein